MKRITLTLPAPYVGLRPFDEKDALLFFGRDNHVRDLLAKLGNQQRFISVLGASGTGKSSLVRAGLIPALHRGALASAGYHWHVHIFKPGDAPLHNLVRALTVDPRWIDNEDRATSESSLRSLLTVSPLALTEQYRQRAERFGNEALLLVVDQFEEIFRYRQKNSDEAEAFIKLLLRTASEDVPIYVVMTMRSDFLGNCVTFFGLPEAINSGLYLTPRLGPDQLKSIIASPLGLVGGDIDSVLVTRLVNTLGGEDELPILEHALLRMWNHAKAAGRNRIEAQDFETVCTSQHSEQAGKATKVAFAIDNHASAIFEALTEKQQQLAKQMFLALVEQRDGRDVRRPQTMQQLIDLLGKDAQPDLQAIMDKFRTEQVGFLLPSCKEVENIHEETQIDISHESLFRQWHLFQQWLKDEALDVSELKEWQQRALRQHHGGGWLDENDCVRAQRWHERVNNRVNSKQWVGRYGDAGIYEQVTGYIETSVQRLNEAKIEHERLEQEKREAVNRLLRVEARNQRESAERAEADKRQAQAFAKASRRRSLIATIAAVIAIAFAVISGVLYSHAEKAKVRAKEAQIEANTEKERAKKMARDNLIGKLVAKAENLTERNPDQSLLLGLAARRISITPETNAFLRFSLMQSDYRNVLRGHWEMVMSAQFSPDGKTILTASLDKTVRLWDAESGKELYSLPLLYGAEIISAQFSPDGNTIMIVSASFDKPIRLWDVVSNAEFHSLRVYGLVMGAQFSPDGKTIVTVSRDETARLWDAVSGEEIRVLNGHEDTVRDAQFSPDGKTIVTASSDKTVRLWNALTGKELYVLYGHKNEVNSAKFSSDGKTIVTASIDKTVRLWDVESRKELHILRGHAGEVLEAQFSPDGKFIVTASTDKTVRLWNVVSGKEIQSLHGHESAVIRAQFSPDGKTILTASSDKTVRLWNAISNKELHVFQGHKEDVKDAQFSSDGKTIVTASKDKTVRLWDVSSGKEIHVLNGHEGEVFGAQFSPDGKTIVTASKDKTARLWDVSSGKEIHVLSGHEGKVFGAQFSPDGKFIVTASEDKTVRLWNAITGREFQVLQEHKGQVFNAQFSPDSKVIVTAGQDGVVRLWDVENGKKLYDFYGHEGQVFSAQFSPDGNTIVTASQDGTARLWNVASGTQIYSLHGHDGWLIGAQFSPDGKFVVTASLGNAIQLWDIESGKKLYSLYGHEGPVSSAQFSPDGNTIVTASEDNTVRLWDVITGRELHTLRGHKNKVQSAQFSPDGQTIVTASDDKTARVWRCEACRPIDEIVTELRRRVGRELTEEELRRFGVPDSVSLAN